jgi:hypothetical protein
MKRILVSFFLALAACSQHATMSAPPGFARIDGPYDVRVVNPRGVVIAAHLEDNDPRADLGFWTSAVDLKLARMGYTREGASDVKSKDGVPGRLFKYDAGNGNAYWVAIFATDRHVLVTEATGMQKDIDASSKEVERALLSATMNG